MHAICGVTYTDYMYAMDDKEPGPDCAQAEHSHINCSYGVLYSELAKSDIIFCQKTKSSLPKHLKVCCSAEFSVQSPFSLHAVDAVAACHCNVAPVVASSSTLHIVSDSTARYAAS